MKYDENKSYCIQATTSYENGMNAKFEECSGASVADCIKRLKEDDCYNIKVYEAELFQLWSDPVEVIA